MISKKIMAGWKDVRRAGKHAQKVTAGLKAERSFQETRSIVNPCGVSVQYSLTYVNQVTPWGSGPKIDSAVNQ